MGGFVSLPVPLLLALGPTALQQKGLVREADSGLFRSDCPMEWPTLWVTPPHPSTPTKAVTSGQYKNHKSG